MKVLVIEQAPDTVLSGPFLRKPLGDYDAVLIIKPGHPLPVFIDTPEETTHDDLGLPTDGP